jgi:hypothetical protein
MFEVKYIKLIYINLRNWSKLYGKPEEHLNTQTTQDVCYKHIVECGIPSSLIYDRDKTLYNNSTEAYN